MHTNYVLCYIVWSKYGCSRMRKTLWDIFQVKRISAMIDQLLEAKRLFEEDRAAAQAAYEAKIEEMRLQYEQVGPNTKHDVRYIKWNEKYWEFSPGKFRGTLVTSNQ